MNTITIDGLSTNGKSTLALMISDYLNYKCLNTGSIYRTYVYYIRKNNIDIEDEKLKEILKNIHIDFNSANVLLNGCDVTKELRTDEINYYSTIWAEVPAIRNNANNFQLKFLKNNNTVIEGRDTGSRIAPDAIVKFYLKSDIDTRVKRIMANSCEEYLEVKKKLEEIDKYDIELKNLVIPEDAITIDTTNLELEEVFKIMIDEIEKRI